MKNLLIMTVVALGLSFSANAGELVFSAGANGEGGTAGGLTINDDDNGDNSPWGLQAEYYHSMSDTLQVGGRIAISDADTAGSDTAFVLGALARYNFGDEMNQAMFATGGVSMADNGSADRIALHLGFGKRFALAENVTWQPNVEVRMDMSGDDDEGMSIFLNIFSFGGFLDLF